MIRRKLNVLANKNYMNLKEKLKYILGLIINIFGDVVARILPAILVGKIIDEGLIKNDYKAIENYFLLSIILYIGGITLAYLGVIIIEKVIKCCLRKTRLSCKILY